MYSIPQQKLLRQFADASDNLLNLGVVSTDSFTGEIGEYVACKYYNLVKTKKVSKAIDAVCPLNKKYQVKAKIVTNNFNYLISNLDSSAFDFLVVVYFDKLFSPIKILRVSADKIENGKISITNSLLKSGIEIVENTQIQIPTKERKAINEFAQSYEKLIEAEIIRSRRIVGDIGEFYACKRLALKLSDNKNEKGFDAKDDTGLTFEIKTRRVYNSARRESETRRLNNLVGKSADFLIVVTLDREFNCNGMWIMPMKNIVNGKSANLKIVNTTKGVLNLIPSTILWLNNGTRFTTFVSPSQKKEADKAGVIKKTFIDITNKQKIVTKQVEDKPMETGWFIFWVIVVAIILAYLN